MTLKRSLYQDKHKISGEQTNDRKVFLSRRIILLVDLSSGKLCQMVICEWNFRTAEAILKSDWLGPFQQIIPKALAESHSCSMIYATI